MTKKQRTLRHMAWLCLIVGLVFPFLLQLSPEAQAAMGELYKMIGTVLSGFVAAG